jgi:hypothetical protein
MITFDSFCSGLSKIGAVKLTTDSGVQLGGSIRGKLTQRIHNNPNNTTKKNILVNILYF